MTKSWIFAILAVVALGLVFSDPQGHDEGNAVFAAVTDSVNPYLEETFSEGTHEEVAATSQEVADWMTQTGEGLGISFDLEATE